MTDTLIIRVSAAWKARLDWNPERPEEADTDGKSERGRGEMRKTSDDDYDEPLLIIWKLTSRRHVRRGPRGGQLWARN